MMQQTHGVLPDTCSGANGMPDAGWFENSSSYIFQSIIINISRETILVVGLYSGGRNLSSESTGDIHRVADPMVMQMWSIHSLWYLAIM